MIKMERADVDCGQDSQYESMVRNAAKASAEELITGDELRGMTDALLELQQAGIKAKEKISEAKNAIEQAKKDFDTALYWAMKVFMVEDHLEDISSDEEEDDE